MEFLIIIIVIVVILILFFTSRLDLKFRGKQTTGTIIDVNSSTYTDQYGVSHTTYSMSYEFQAEDGQVYRGKKSTKSRRMRVGDLVTVYYLPNNPNRNDAN